MLDASERGARLTESGKRIQAWRSAGQHKKAKNHLLFLWGQLYNGKLAKRHGHAPTDACRLCGMPDSCTHIGGECNGSNGLFIKRHNAAVQLVRAMVRNCAMGGDALHSTPLVLVTCDAGAQPQTSMENVLAMDASAASDYYDKEMEEWRMRTPLARVVPLIPRQVSICPIRPNLECRTAWTLKMLGRCKQMWKVLKPRDSSQSGSSRKLC